MPVAKKRCVAVLFSLSFFSIGTTSAIGAISPAQRRALIAIYEATNGDYWTDNSGWKTPPLDTDGFALPGTEGSWYGVSVGNGYDYYEVHELKLVFNNLSGTLPNAIADLTTLIVLDLSFNQLIGPIPAGLGCVDYQQGDSGVVLINLSHNMLTGPIPPDLGDSFGGPVKLTVDLSFNQLTGSIPPELGNLSSDDSDLVLDLSNNHLSGDIPAGLSSLYWDRSDTLTLDLSHNELSGLIPEEFGRFVRRLFSDVKLDLSHNQLSGTLPAELFYVTGWPEEYGYTYYDFGFNLLTGPLPSEFGVIHLKSLKLNNNSLTGMIPASLGNLTDLQHLSIGSNNLIGELPGSLSNLANIDPSDSDFGYNALYSNDPLLAEFITSKDPDWESTQTVVPIDIDVTPIGGTTILVSWTPIDYRGDDGGYQVSLGDAEGGPYSVVDQTLSKNTSSMLITGLLPGHPYYAVMKTITDPHELNSNRVESEVSVEVSCATFSQITIAGSVLSGSNPLSGVLMSGLPGNPMTNAGGMYQCQANVGWTGTVTPALPGFVFIPSNRSYFSQAFDQWTQDYQGVPIPPGIILVSPNGNEKLVVGGVHNITWGWTGVIEKVDIDYSYNGGLSWYPVVRDAINTGSYLWSIPWPSSKACLVKVSQNDDHGIFDQSNAPFLIACKKDMVATWDGQGCYYLNSDSGGFVRLASPATMIAAGDLDGDGLDDLIGLWPTQGGIWVKYSQSGAWSRLSSTAVHIGAGDMNGDGREDLLGTWDGQGVYYCDSISGAWIRLASPATLITAGDIDDDGTDDLIGIWPAQGGVWVKYSHSGAWARLSSTARDIAAGDMNGDGRDDLLATWDGQGVYYRNSANGAWVRMASQAEQVTCGDLDADGMDDLIGIWPTQGGVWMKNSESGAWALLSSTARDLAAGTMRTPVAPSAAIEGTDGSIVANALDQEMPLPMGGHGEGPNAGSGHRDLSGEGPGGVRFVFIEEQNLVPNEGSSEVLARIPGPGEPGFVAEDQKNLFPQERPDREKAPSKEMRKPGDRIQKML